MLIELNPAKKDVLSERGTYAIGDDGSFIFHYLDGDVFHVPSEGFARRAEKGDRGWGICINKDYVDGWGENNNEDHYTILNGFDKNAWLNDYDIQPIRTYDDELLNAIRVGVMSNLTFTAVEISSDGTSTNERYTASWDGNTITISSGTDSTTSDNTEANQQS